MLSESVAQKPTMAVSWGTKTFQNSPVVLNWDFCENTEDTEPVIWCTFQRAQNMRARPPAMRNGAAQDSSHLIESMPCQTKWTLMSQKSRKQPSCHQVMPRTVMLCA